MPQSTKNNAASGERVAKLLSYLGMSHKEFAEKYGKTDSSVSAYVKGETPLRLDVALAIKEEYKISLDWIYAGDGVGQVPLITRTLERQVVTDGRPNVVSMSSGEKGKGRKGR